MSLAAPLTRVILAATAAAAALGFWGCQAYVSAQPLGIPASGLGARPMSLTGVPEVPGARIVDAPECPFDRLVGGDPARPLIALTFDDGPHAGFTDRLLSVLAVHGVRATMFMIGRNVVKHPGLARRAHELGHEVVNHTYTHRRLRDLTEAQIRWELEAGAEAIARETGVRPRFFRPPGGEYDERVLRIAKEFGLTMVLWTADGGDFTTAAGNPPAQTIVDKVVRESRPGGIVILHDPMPSTLAAIPEIVARLESQGLRFATVSEMAATPSPVTVGGPSVRRWRGLLPSSAQPVPGTMPGSTERTENEDSSEGAPSPPAPQGAAHQGTGRRGQGQQGQGPEEGSRHQARR